MSSRADVEISGDVGPLRQKLREATQTMQKFGQEAGESLGTATGPLDALRGKFIALTGILAGGALFGKAISETAAYTEQSIQLGKALGDTAGGASVWIGTLDDAGASVGEFSAASRGLLKNLQADEQAMNAMGLATRGANGELRPMKELMLDAIRLVNEHKEGTDRNIAANQLFGKTVDASSNLLKINVDAVEQNQAFMRELGLEVGQNMVDAYGAYDDAMDRSELVVKALKTTIGNALIPVVTKLGEWFNTVGPAAVVVLRGAIGGLTSVFWGLKNAVTVAWEVLNAMVYSVAEPLRSLVAGLYKVITGDFQGAQQELAEWPERVGQAWSTAWGKIVASSEDARDRLGDLFTESAPAASPAAPGGKTAKVKPKEDDSKEKVTQSFMQYYEAALAEEKRLASERDALRDYTKEEELAFWRLLLDNLELTNKDRVAITRKTADLEVGIRRKQAQEERDLGAAEMAARTTLALGEVNARRTAAQAAVAVGQMSNEQLLRQEIEFEGQKYEIQRAALEQRLELAMTDPNTSPAERKRINTEMLQLEQEHGIAKIQLITQLNTDLNKEMEGSFNQIGDLFGSELGNTLEGAQTWQQGLGNIFRGAGQIFMQEMITKPFAAWVANNARMLANKLGFLTAETTATGTAAAATATIKGTETTTVVGANAAQAGSGAAKAMAGIPYVGPILALAAMAAIFAAVMGMASAEGGYDIPHGVNPMTQLHEEEMVLPKQFANVIRGLAQQDDQSVQTPASAPVELTGVSAGDFFIANRKQLIQVLSGGRRDFAFKG